LRNALPGFLVTAIDHHPSPQVPADQLKDALIAHLFADTVHETVVVHGVEEFSQVAIHGHTVSLADIVADLVDGL
jgi:hypothetical protein